MPCHALLGHPSGLRDFSCCRVVSVFGRWQNVRPCSRLSCTPRTSREWSRPEGNWVGRSKQKRTDRNGRARASVVAVEWRVRLTASASVPRTLACWCHRRACRAASRHVPTRCWASCRRRTDAWIHPDVGRLRNKTWSISWPSLSCECKLLPLFLGPSTCWKENPRPDAA